jgi:hypothetical protein
MAFQKPPFQPDAFAGLQVKPTADAFQRDAFQPGAFQEGSVTESGGVKVDYALTCDSGAYSYSGGDATFAFSGAPSVATVAPASGVRGAKRRKSAIAVVEYDGRDYRVPLDSLDSFLELIKQKAETPKPVKVIAKKKKKTLQVSTQSPRLVIKSAPPDFMAEFRQFVDRSNEVLDKIWQGLVSRELAELDDEEAVLLLI